MNTHYRWFLLFPLSQLFALTGFYVSAPGIGSEIALALFLLALGLCISADIGLFFAYRKLRENYLLEQKNKRIEEQLNIHQQHYDSLVNSIAQQKKIQHDYINQIQAIYTLLNDHCVEEAKGILENQQELILQSRRINYCKNRIVDAVVMNKVRLAEAAQIKTSVAIDLAEETPFKNIDLCNLFSNILDNAITSCQAVSHDTRERSISLTCGEKGGYLIVKCRNSKENAVSLTKKSRVQTTKDNPSEHGYGLMIVEEIAAKYKGRCAISYDDEYFQITVFLAAAL